MFQYVLQSNLRMQALFPLGHGRCISDVEEPLYLGDVGIIREESFVKVFNITLPRYHPKQGRLEHQRVRHEQLSAGKTPQEPFLPESFKPFKLPLEIAEHHRSRGISVHGFNECDVFEPDSLGICICGEHGPSGSGLWHHRRDCSRSIEWFEPAVDEDLNLVDFPLGKDFAAYMRSQLKIWWDFFGKDFGLPSPSSLVCIYDKQLVGDECLRQQLRWHLRENGTEGTLYGTSLLNTVMKADAPYSITFVSYVQLKEVSGWPVKPVARALSGRRETEESQEGYDPLDVFAEYLSGLEMQGSSKTSNMESRITGKYVAVTSEHLYYLFREADLAVPNNSHDLRRALHDFPFELMPVRLPQAKGEIRPIISLSTQSELRIKEAKVSCFRVRNSHGAPKGKIRSKEQCMRYRDLFDDKDDGPSDDEEEDLVEEPRLVTSILHSRHT